MGIGKGRKRNGRERRGERGREGKEGGERERTGAEGKGKGRDPTKFREKLTPLDDDVVVVS